jgi:small conductance mechanosensitive channel
VRKPAAATAALAAGLLTLTAFGQQPQPAEEPDAPVPAQVGVQAAVSDGAIATRLTDILEATGWFENIDVRVESGVAFLGGTTDTASRQDWSEQLANNTEGVVAVVNDIRIEGGPFWDLSPAWEQAVELGRATIRHSPLIVVSLVLLVITWLVARSAVRGSRTILERHVRSKLLRDVVARIVAVPVFLLGLYLVLRVSGLTGLAVTVIGSTGLIGLVLGFAFRDIAENFLSSVLISMNQPFATGDRIEVAGHHGFVQSVNTRSTLLMTLEGNHVQIPNASIYKGTIINYTANPNARFDFPVGIGYEDSISEAQRIALQVLKDHPAVIDDPESLVMVEQLGAATVNLRIYFWVDVRKFSHVKVRSAVIRQIKTAFQEAGISMPDEAREVVFPKGVPVRMLSADAAPGAEPGPARDQLSRLAADADQEAYEGDYESEAGDIARQARSARNPEGGENLLD